MCRAVASLQDQTPYSLCLTAEDAFFNVQEQATQLRFTTRDGTPPSLVLAAAPFPPRSATSPSFASECFAVVKCSLSEPGSGVIVAVPSGTDLSNLPSAVLLARTWPVTLSVLQTAAFSAIRADDNFTSVELSALPCDAEVVLAAAVRDTLGNVNSELQSLMLQLPDVVPPRFLATTPQLAATASTAAYISVQLDEPGAVALQVRRRVINCIVAKRMCCTWP